MQQLQIFFFVYHSFTMAFFLLAHFELQATLSSLIEEASQNHFLEAMLLAVQQFSSRELYSIWTTVVFLGLCPSAKNDWTFTPPIIQEIYYVFVQILCFIFLDYVVFQLIFFIFLNLLSDRFIGNILLFGILLIHFNNIKNKIKNGLIVYMITHILITPVKVVYFSLIFILE